MLKIKVIFGVKFLVLLNLASISRDKLHMTFVFDESFFSKQTMLNNLNQNYELDRIFNGSKDNMTSYFPACSLNETILDYALNEDKSPLIANVILSLTINDLAYSGPINIISWHVDDENAVDHFGIQILIDEGEAEDAYQYANDNIIGTELKLNLGKEWDKIRMRTFQVLLIAYGENRKVLKTVRKTGVKLECYS